MRYFDMYLFIYYQLTKKVLITFSKMFKVVDDNYLVKKIGDKKILSEIAGNQEIATLIKSNIPFMAARYGTTELGTINRYIGKQFGINKKYHNNISINAGFFPFEDKYCDKYAKLMIDCSSNLDCLFSLDTLNERYVIRKYTNNAKLFRFTGLEPYYHNEPWSKELKGKKVLVIHPFVDTIFKQYDRRRELFKDQNVLPDFELKIYKSVQSISGNVTQFKDWFEALDHMTEEIRRIDFDVAIIGCGAYGFPLASRIKDMGKQAIHMGGSTQILFGIKGARWDNGTLISKLYNDSWVRPSENERPKNAEAVEGGCYW